MSDSMSQHCPNCEAQAAEIEKLRGKLALITRIYPQKTGSAYTMVHIAREALGETK